MGKLMVNFLFFTVSIQMVAFIFQSFNIFGGLIDYPIDFTATQGLFAPFTAYSVMVGVGGGALIGVAMLLLKQGVYAIYALLLWAFGVIFNVVQQFFLAIPNTIAALIPESTNPLVGQVNPLITVVLFIGLFGTWWAFFGYILQREAT